jgi:hypothetical protein
MNDYVLRLGIKFSKLAHRAGFGNLIPSRQLPENRQKHFWGTQNWVISALLGLYQSSVV